MSDELPAQNRCFFCGAEVKTIKGMATVDFGEARSMPACDGCVELCKLEPIIERYESDDDCEKEMRRRLRLRRLAEDMPWGEVQAHMQERRWRWGGWGRNHGFFPTRDQLIAAACRLLVECQPGHAISSGGIEANRKDRGVIALTFMGMGRRKPVFQAPPIWRVTTNEEP